MFGTALDWAAPASRHGWQLGLGWVCGSWRRWHLCGWADVGLAGHTGCHLAFVLLCLVPDSAVGGWLGYVVGSWLLLGLVVG